MLITYLEITQQTKIARSTIMRRAKALKIEPHKKPLGHSGRRANALTAEEMQAVVNFIPTKRNGEYKTSAEKSANAIKRKFEKTESYITENRERGLYPRLTLYGGLYNAKDWTA